jgi:hypothetical protein
VDIKSNSKEFWNKHVRSLGLLMIFYLFSLTSFGQSNECKMGDLPEISFRSNSGGLSTDAKSMLATVASKLKGNPFCSIIVSGYPAASKAGQALCNKRVSVIKTYLLEKEGISADRINLDCEIGGGDPNIVDLKAK